VVNSGSPVLLPWRDEVSAVLLSWFGGQEYGDAVAEILLGRAEPGGRLPTTWPIEQADVPVIDVTPKNGVVLYDEGIHIGYRAWLKAGTEPAYEFGHGLGYTSWSIDDLALDSSSIAEGGTVSVAVRVTNTGSRQGKQVVQLYASRENSSIDRPVRWLVGFAAVRVEPGESAWVTIAVSARAFADWGMDAQGASGWHYEQGTFQLHAGTSVSKLALSKSIEVTVTTSLVE
jgi:beta-glucosidase